MITFIIAFFIVRLLLIVHDAHAKSMPQCFEKVSKINDSFVIHLLNMTKVRMSDRERDTFVRYLINSTAYFEFGMGGSTKLSAHILLHPNSAYKLKKITSIDNDVKWVYILI